METLLRIQNDGPAIVATNYWQTRLARQGKFFLSGNAGVFRLLVPALHLGTLQHMRQAHTCVVSRGPWPHQGLPDAIGILFDDDTVTPFSVLLSIQSCDRLPIESESGTQFLLSVWAPRIGETCLKALEFPCYYRRSPSLPDLRPWGGV